MFDLSEIPEFIMLGLFIDVFIFHHFRKDGDIFDGSDKYRKGTISQYVNCCLCHGFTIGVLLTLFIPNHDLGDLILGGAMISVSALTYRILVLKE